MSGKLETPALTVDQAQVQEAARQWRGRNRYGLTVRPAQLSVGLLYMVLGIGGLIFLQPAALTSLQGITSAGFVMNSAT